MNNAIEILTRQHTFAITN